MRLSDFDYELPPGLIAQFPLEKRGDSRLLCLDGVTGAIEDRRFGELAELLRPGDLLVLNNTRVMPARLIGRKETGGKVEVLVERLVSADRALAHIRASKAPRPGACIRIGSQAVLEVGERQGDLFEIVMESGDFPALMEAEGHMPLPPYIARQDSDFDRERYQTVYAERPGAVAAPTAGLHFEREMLDRLAERGVETGWITLHVGAGTFQPVRVENLDEHRMHSEYVEVDPLICRQISENRARGGRLVAVGTTSVRSLESAAVEGRVQPFRGETRLFIRPGYAFSVVDALITNFHLPKSTLLMLVSAFGGYERVLAAYRHAVANRYRFFSYGDAMFLTRRADAA